MMAIASIKNLPDTIMDRSIKINMRIRLPTEKIESLREQYVKEEFETIKQKCRRFISDNGKQAGEYIMEPVNGLSDRACDVWEGLAGIASIFGDEQRVIKTADNDVRQLAGHSSLSTTQRYIEYNTEAHKKIIEMI